MFISQCSYAIIVFGGINAPIFLLKRLCVNMEDDSESDNFDDVTIDSIDEATAVDLEPTAVT